MIAWLRDLRRRNPGASWGRLALWETVRISGGLMLMALYRFRWWGTRHIPDTGGVLLICNHQSFFDLLAIGMAVPHRHFHSMARKTLFDAQPLGALITGLNAFPVDQEKSDLKSIRTAIDKLKQGQLVLVFPEGTRTPDGAMRPFQEGIMLLIRRARPTIVPMALDGFHDAYPIGGKRPALRGRVGLLCGEPIDPNVLLAMPSEEARHELERSVAELRDRLRTRLREQSLDRYPLPGPGDQPGIAGN